MLEFDHNKSLAKHWLNYPLIDMLKQDLKVKIIFMLQDMKERVLNVMEMVRLLLYNHFGRLNFIT